MPKLKGQIGELGFTLNIKRKATGKVETYHMIGKVMENPTPKVKEKDNGRNA